MARWVRQGDCCVASLTICGSEIRWCFKSSGDNSGVNTQFVTRHVWDSLNH